MLRIDSSLPVKKSSNEKERVRTITTHSRMERKSNFAALCKAVGETQNHWVTLLSLIVESLLFTHIHTSLLVLSFSFHELSSECYALFVVNYFPLPFRTHSHTRSHLSWWIWFYIEKRHKNNRKSFLYWKKKKTKIKKKITYLFLL